MPQIRLMKILYATRFTPIVTPRPFATGRGRSRIAARQAVTSATRAIGNREDLRMRSETTGNSKANGLNAGSGYVVLERWRK
jgi:hypothetical protein